MGSRGVLVKRINKIDFRVITAALAVVLSLVCMQGSPASAATANTLKVSPVRSDVEVKPGESKTIKVLVTNLTDQEVSVQPTVNDFVAGDERGAPALVLDANKFAPSHSLKRFMSPLESVTIPAKKNQLLSKRLLRCQKQPKLAGILAQ